jgi:hypothetical protein
MKKNIQPLQCIEKPEVFTIIQWWPPYDHRHDPEETPIKRVPSKMCLNCAGIEEDEIYSQEDEDGGLEYYYNLDEEHSFCLMPGCYIMKSNYGVIRFVPENEFNARYQYIDTKE